MKRLIDLQTPEDFSEFSEILSKISDSNIVGTLKQVAARPDGLYNYTDLQQAVADSKVVVQIDNGYLYVTVQNLRRVDVRKLKTMWNTVLTRGTQQFRKGLANDYIMVIDIIKDELQKGFVYCITAAQPTFVSGDGDNDLMFAFSLENARCSKDEVSQYDVEYEAALREESGNEVYNFNDDVDDDNNNSEDTFDENSDIIDNSSFI